MGRGKPRGTQQNLNLTNPTDYAIISTSKGRKTLKNQKGIDTMSKLTNKVALSTILNTTFDFTTVDFSNDEIRDKLSDMLASLENRKSATKPTKNQVENETFKADIANLLSDGKARTVTEIMQEIFPDKELSNQRVSAILRLMIIANQVKKDYVKGKAYFQLV